MFENHHQYECQHCRIPIIGNSLEQLCNNLNDHNDQKHPGEWAKWSAKPLSCSPHYSAPENEEEDPRPTDNSPSAAHARRDPQFGTPMPEMRIQHIVDPTFPKITAADLRFLKEHKVRWI